jgi:O-antigen/teichoic acid export membrane protein
VQPRLTYLNATGNEPGLRATYAEATQMLSAIALTASFTLAFGARPLLWAWTGNAELADRTAAVLSFYALCNGFLAVVAMTYYLQVARGDLRLHLRGNMTFALLLLPTIVLATLSWGMLGASLAWCGANLWFLLVWSVIVHKRFLPGQQLRWLLRDALLPGLAGAIGSLSLHLVPWTTLGRFPTALALAGVGAFSASLATLATSPAQRVIRRLRTGRGTAP